MPLALAHFWLPPQELDLLANGPVTLDPSQTTAVRQVRQGAPLAPSVDPRIHRSKTTTWAPSVDPWIHRSKTTTWAPSVDPWI